MPINWRGVHNFIGNVRILNRSRQGSSGSYTQHAADGRQTMVGAAQVYKDYWIPATKWLGIYPAQFLNPFNANFSSAGSTVTVGNRLAEFTSDAGSPALIPVMSASAATNTDSRMATCFLSPADAATTGSVAVSLYFTSRLAMATTGSSQVYRMHYCYLGTGTCPSLEKGGSIVYCGSMATTGSGKLEVWDLGDLPSFSSTASPLVFLQLTLEQSNGSCMAGSAEDCLFGVNLRFVSDSLGVQVT